MYNRMYLVSQICPPSSSPPLPPTRYHHHEPPPPPTSTSDLIHPLPTTLDLLLPSITTPSTCSSHMHPLPILLPILQSTAPTADPPPAPVATTTYRPPPPSTPPFHHPNLLLLPFPTHHRLVDIMLLSLTLILPSNTLPSYPPSLSHRLAPLTYTSFFYPSSNPSPPLPPPPLTDLHLPFPPFHHP